MLSLAAASTISTGCGSDGGSGGTGQVEPPPPPTAELEVAVTFPNDTAQAATATLHVWAVVGKTDAAPTCAALIGGALDPYDLALERRADVAVEPSKLPALATGVLLGPALVYVEAVSFEGVVELAGCAGPVDVQQPKATALVTLQKAGVFDCADPATEIGAPCDDGKLCTIGEKCSGGQCKGGVTRDCTHVADSCNAGNCDDTLGCVATPLPDGEPCDDSLYCTEGDICTAGACGGKPRDCSTTGNPCQTASGCDESLDQCVYEDAPSGTACDDGNFCTVNDECSWSGSCYGTSRDCSAVADQCNNPSCDESLDACVPLPKSSIYSCSDTLGCTTSDHCNGQGQCIGTAKSCVTFNDQCNTGTCEEPLGTCVKVPLPNGTTCDDGNPATTGDVCTTGVCAGT
jgi:hypothetical protein